MPFISFIFSAMLILAGSTAAALWNSRTAAVEAAHKVSGASMRIVAAATSEFMRDHPGQDGEVSTAALSSYLPTWFNGDSRIRVASKAGRGYVFIAPAGGDRVSTDDVIAGSDMPVTLGIAMNGKFVSRSAGTVMFDLPSIIPNGAVVYVV